MRDWPVVAVLREAIRSGGGQRHYQAAKEWSQGEVNREAAAEVARVMRGQSLPAALGLAAGGQFAGVSRLLDVGGGAGCFALALARRHPDLRCTVMDLPAMCEVLAREVDAAGLGRQVEIRAVDMLREPWPDGHDAVLLSNIFHDWDPQTNADLAGAAFAALPRGGRVFVHEMLLDDDGAGPLAAASFSVMLLLATGGRQYAAREVAGFLESAGFCDPVVTDAYGYYSLVTARKP
jgi:acetylserotonin N-methyltransferase